MLRPPPPSPLFPYTTLFRSGPTARHGIAPPTGPPCVAPHGPAPAEAAVRGRPPRGLSRPIIRTPSEVSPQGSQEPQMGRSEEHTSELQSHVNLVCRLLLEKK